MTRFIAACLLSAGALAAQMQPPPQQDLTLDFDSGRITNTTSEAKVLFSQLVRIPSATWIRVWFDKANLPVGSRLRIIGQRHGWVQNLDADSLVRYFNKSCFFGGDAVRVELVGGPGTVDNRIHISGASIGIPGPETICGSTDDRVLSYNDRQGRLQVGCTGWLISPDVMLTAGHCFATASQILSFKVPLSTSTGAIQPSHPDDQYPTISSTVKRLDSGIGADWGICRIGLNSNTALRPGDAYGSWYTLGAVPGSVSGQNINITGYGTTSLPVSKTWNQVQKTHTGPLYGITTTSLRYRTDTTGGNSGSPIYHTNTGRVIGIHTHGGCSTSSSSYNSGTRIDRSDLQTEINKLMAPVVQRSYFVPDSSATTGTCNVIPFGSTSPSSSWANQKYQCLIYRSDIGNVSSATIRNLGFAPCGSGIRRFSTITIRMAQTNQNTLSTTFANNMDYNVRTVLSKAKYEWHNTMDQWNRISLDANYPYDSSTAKNIVVEITVAGAYMVPSTGADGFHRDERERVQATGWTGSPPSIGSRDTAAAKIEICTTAPDLHLFGVGCVGSNRRVPQLSLSGSASVNGKFVLGLSDALPRANAFLSLNVYRYYAPFDFAVIGAPKCNMYFSDLVLAAVTCSTSGTFQMPVVVPRTVPIGQRVYAQFFPLDAKANLLGVTSSNYGSILVGN